MNNLEQLIAIKIKLTKEIENFGKKNNLLKIVIYALSVVTAMTIFNHIVITSLIAVLTPLIYTNISIRRLYQKFIKIYNINNAIKETKIEIIEPPKSKEYLKKEQFIRDVYQKDFQTQNLNTNKEQSKKTNILETNETERGNNMFKLLKENIGTNIRCTYWKNETLITEIIKLDRVDEYDSIYSDNFKWIHFLNYNECIIKIDTLDGKILYENTLFKKKFKNIQSKEELSKYQKQLFGKNYLTEKEQANKNNLLEIGLKEIAENQKEELLNFINSNSKNIILATFSMLNKINNGMNYYQAEILTYTSEFILSGEEMQIVTNAVIYFLGQNKSFELYRNKCDNQKINKKKTLKK